MRALGLTVRVRLSFRLRVIIRLGLDLELSREVDYQVGVAVRLGTLCSAWSSSGVMGSAFRSMTTRCVRGANEAVATLSRYSKD